MVRVYPFNAFAAPDSVSRSLGMGKCDISSGIPNRFSVNRSYDRSVVIDRDNDEYGKCQDVRMRNQANADLQRQTPVVVISRVKGKEKDQDSSCNSLCSEHGITFRNVREFIDGGILELVKEQSFLIYSQETRSGGGHRQIGICAALAVEDCLKGSIKRHEKVTKDVSVSQKRFSNSSHPRNVDPVMMMYRQSDVIQSIIDKITTREAPVIMQARSRHNSRLGVSDDDDTHSAVSEPDDHRIWSITAQEDIEAIRTAFLEIDSLYIADGHHRTAAACRMALQNKGREGLRSPSHSKYLLGFLYPHTHMRVIPYNRCVSSLGDKTPLEFLRLVSTVFRISEHDSGKRIFGTESTKGEMECSTLCVLDGKSSTYGWPILTPLTIPQSVSRCSSPSMSPQKNIVRGLVVSLDSGSDSDSDGSSDNDDEDDGNLIGDDLYSSSPRGGRVGPLQDPGKKPNRHLEAVANLELDVETIDKNGTNVLVARESVSSSAAEALEKKTLIGPRRPHIIAMYFEGRWLDLIPLETVEEKEGDPLGSLDIQVLFERLLRPVLGIECPRTDHRMIYVCGSEGTAGLEARVNNKAACVAFRVGRVTVADIMRVADAGQLMPPKATCFNPKPLSGLLVRLH